MSSFSSEGLPRPEEFPVGSAERRAAARALLDLREKGARRIQLILDMANRQRRGRAVASGTGWKPHAYRLPFSRRKRRDKAAAVRHAVVWALATLCSSCAGR